MGADTFLIIPEKKTSNEQQKNPQRIIDSV